MHAFVAGFRLELRIIRAAPEAFIPLVTTPLFALIFLSIVRQSGRLDLQADALMAPVLMTLWWIALQQAGNPEEHDGRCAPPLVGREEGQQETSCPWVDH